MEACAFHEEHHEQQGAMPPPFAKVGCRIRATIDWYPARAGAIGLILRFEGGNNKRVIVQWENPAQNLAPFAQSDLHVYDLEYFEDMPPTPE
jgi:hypothetical protein